MPELSVDQAQPANNDSSPETQASKKKGPMWDLLFTFLIFQFTKLIDTSNPSALLGVRISWVISQLFIIAFCLVLYMSILKKNDTTQLRYIETRPGLRERYLIVTTNMDYDLGHVSYLAKQAVLSVALVAFIHYKWGYVQPLIFQMFLPLRGILTHKVVQIHFWGRRAILSLERPFKSAEGSLAAYVTPKQRLETEEELKAHLEAEKKLEEEKKNEKKQK
ncbi:uncharacterized protein VTP21DRAFT_8099 [Calcarisporiella thermophila]|uniref:uncharacterized protein n=1 Tax=Calcarisporiella thermophila TaxID=911321 RepID=UPI00374492C8